MATQVQPSPANSRTSSAHNGANDAYANPPPTGRAPAAANTKKAKSKKSPDVSETQNLIQTKISQIESDYKVEASEENEIKREVNKATKDLNNLLQGMTDPIARVDAIRKRNTDLMQELKRLEREHTKNKKRTDQLQKEKDAQRQDLTKALAQKDKLEKLARELTKENKKSKDDIKHLHDVEAEQRSKMCKADEALLADIEDFMEDKKSIEEQAKNMEVEEVLRSKFKTLTDQFSARELHFNFAMRARDAEVNHITARLEQQKQLYEKEVGQSRNLNAQVQTFSQTETELRSQLNIYVEKFKQVEDTLNNSNELFLTFRKEMESMSSKTKRLEKENLNLTRKHDLNNRNIIEMAEDRTKTSKENQRLLKQIATLKSTIRQMQSQGRSLPTGTSLEPEDNATESEYDSEEEYEPRSGDDVYDDDETEDDLAHASVNNPPTFGPPPPPPPAAASKMANGHPRSEVNGTVAR